MKTFYHPVKRTAKRLFHYARLTFLSGASVLFTIYPGISQDNNNGATSASASAKYHRISSLTTGPSVKYNITQFVTPVLPTDAILFSNNSAYQINGVSVALLETSESLAIRARQTMLKARQAQTKEEAARLSKKADSLDNNSVGKRFESAETMIRADQIQFGANAEQIKEWQQKVKGNSDVLTSAWLLLTDAENYYSLALNQIQKSDTCIHIYVKQDFMEAAQKYMETAIIKQQCAENIYISLDPNTAISIAQRIDSLLSVPADAKSSMPVTINLNR